jgi:hypothetical protein
MNKKWRSQAALLVFIILCFVLTMTVNSFAFDKERKGFILGFGLGPGFSSYSQTIDSTGGKQIDDESLSKAALFTDFKIGYAPSNQLMIYWLSKVNWFGREDTIQTTTSTRKEAITVANGVGGLGITYFFKPKAPSIYVTVGGGFSARSEPFRGTDAWLSYGFAGALGWEFQQNWALELSALYGKPTHSASPYDYDANFTGIGLSINVLGY